MGKFELGVEDLVTIFAGWASAELFSPFGESPLHLPQNSVYVDLNGVVLPLADPRGGRQGYFQN